MSIELECFLDTCREAIDHHGFMVNLCDATPLPYAYTIGLTPLIDRELFLVGQDEEAALIILNEAALQVLEMGIQADERLIQSDRTTDLKLRTVRVDMHMGTLFHLLPRLGYKPTRLLQVVVADALGAFPNQAHYDGPTQAIDCCVIRSTAQLH